MTRLLGAFVAALILTLPGVPQVRGSQSPSKGDGQRLYYVFTGKASGADKGGARNTATDHFSPLEGKSIRWTDQYNSPSGSLTVNGEAKGQVVTYRIKGSVSVRSLSGDSEREEIRYENRLTIVPANSVSSADVHVSMSGSISGASSLNSNGNYASFRSALSNEDELELSAEKGKSASDRQGVDRAYSFKFTRPTSRIIPPGRPGSLGSTTVHSPKGIPEDFVSRPYNPLLISFGLKSLGLAASAKGGSATAEIDVVVRVVVALDGEALPPASSDSAIKLLQATSPARDTIEITFDVKEPVTESVFFDIYRSAKPQVDPKTQQADLVERVRISSSLEEPGEYSTSVDQVSTKTDRTKPYFVVVRRDTTDQVYFRKWNLLVVAHGYAGFLDQDRERTRQWVDRMTTMLKEDGLYDEARSWLWLDESWRGEGGHTETQGRGLSRFVLQEIRKRDSAHAGDVVDCHLVGHSRGAVVVSWAMRELVKDEAFTRSLVWVTLLDAHPASPSSVGFRSVSGVFGSPILAGVEAFYEDARDDEPSFPEANYEKFEIWFQKTDVSEFPSGARQSFLNLHGIGPADNRISHPKGLKVEWKNVTTFEGQSGPPVGHDEVPLEYLASRMTKA